MVFEGSSPGSSRAQVARSGLPWSASHFARARSPFTHSSNGSNKWPAQSARTVGECAARVGRACLTEKAVATGALGLRIDGEQDIPAVVFTHRVDIDLIIGQRALEGGVDPGEGKVLNLVGSRPDADVDRETVAVFFQPGEKGALDFATRHVKIKRRGQEACSYNV